MKIKWFHFPDSFWLSNSNFKLLRFHRNKIWIQLFKESTSDYYDYTEDDSSIVKTNGNKSIDDGPAKFNEDNDDFESYYSEVIDGSFGASDITYGDFIKRKRRGAREIHAEGPEEEPPTREDTNHKKKFKTIDTVDSHFDHDLTNAGLFLGPSGIDDLQGQFILNITWPFLQYEKPNECSDDNSEILEGDERCVCDQIIQHSIDPAVETTACITQRDQDRDTDILLGSVCGSDKFGEPICFLNGCGDIISG